MHGLMREGRRPPALYSTLTYKYEIPRVECYGMKRGLPYRLNRKAISKHHRIAPLSIFSAGPHVKFHEAVPQTVPDNVQQIVQD